jgi:hypothetical protein
LAVISGSVRKQSSDSQLVAAQAFIESGLLDPFAEHLEWRRHRADRLAHIELRGEVRVESRIGEPSSPGKSCYERNQQVLDLEHYLDVLERSPVRWLGPSHWARWRQRGLWPGSYDRLYRSLCNDCLT